MDNADDNIIIPKKSSKTPVYAEEKLVTENRKKPSIVIISLIGLLFVAILLFSAIIINNHPAEVDTNIGETAVEETLYITPDDVEDAQAAYSEWLENQKADAETEEESFDAELIIIENMIVNNQLDDALSRTDLIGRDGLTDEQLFRLYNLYTRIFMENGNEESYNEYVDLRTKQIDILLGQ